jgi:hypothetical protein
LVIFFAHFDLLETSPSSFMPYAFIFIQNIYLFWVWKTQNLLI